MLRIRRLGIDTCHETVAYLARRCPLYRAQEFVALARIEISTGARRIVATLNIVDDETLMAPDELGLSTVAFRHLGLPEGTLVEIAEAKPPASLDHVRAKIDGAELSADAFQSIAQDLAAHRYSKMEIAAFLIASARFMTAPEVLSLTRAMASVGGRLNWNGDTIVDKHCIGGIPGNRTSMIVVPIVAALGETIRIRYMNEGIMYHPFHSHGYKQTVVARDGYPLGANAYDADTVTVGPGERWDVNITADRLGLWAYHCHILPHVEGSNGMFGMVNVLIVVPKKEHVDAIVKAKPSGAKGKYLRKAAVSSTMGPGIPVDPNLVKNLTAEDSA